MWLRPGRTSPGTCQAFMGCRPAGRERQDRGRTERSWSVWLVLRTKSELARTNSISLAEPNLDVNSKTGFRPNVSSRPSSRGQRIGLSPGSLRQAVDRNIVKEQENM